MRRGRTKKLCGVPKRGQTADNEVNGGPDFDKVHLRQTSVQQCFSQGRQGKEPISIYFDNKQIVIFLVSEIILGMRDLPVDKDFQTRSQSFLVKKQM